MVRPPRVSVALGLAAALAVGAAEVAGAVPGGSLAGSITVEWRPLMAGQAEDWSGRAVIVLDSGGAARQAAVDALAALPHKRQPKTRFQQGARLVELQGVRRSSPPCEDEAGARPWIFTSTVLGIVDGRLPFQVDPASLDLLRGRGTVQLGPAYDNVGDPLPDAGAYVLALPGRADVRATQTGCGSVEPGETTGPAAALGARGDALIPFAFSTWLNALQLGLRRGADGAWVARGTTALTDDAIAVPLALNVSYDLRLAVSPATASASCHVPTDRELRGALSVAQALAIVRRAGFPRARLRAAVRAQVPRGRYFVEQDFTSSGEAACGTARPPIRRSLGPPRR